MDNNPSRPNLGEEGQTDQDRLRININILMALSVSLVNLMENHQMRMLLDSAVPPVPAFTMNGTLGIGVETLRISPVANSHDFVGCLAMTTKIRADAQEAVLFATLGVVEGFHHGHEVVGCIFEAGG